MCSVIKNEFYVRKFGLDHDQPHLFTRPQWKIPRIIFLVYRVVLAGYTFAVLVYYIHYSETKPFRFHHSVVYMTIWNYILLTCHFVINCVAACVLDRHTTRDKNQVQLTGVASVSPSPGSKDNGTGHKNRDEACSSTNLTFTEANALPLSTATLPWYLKIIWIVANINSVFAIISTGVTYGLLFKPGWSISFGHFNTHAMNTVFIVVDNFISSRPVRLLHFTHPLIYAVVYMIFTVVYWAAGEKTAIYSVLNWNNPGLTVGFCFAVLAVILVLQVVYFALFRLRVFLHSKLSPPKRQ